MLGIKLLASLSIGAAALAFTLVVWQRVGADGALLEPAFAVLWPGIVLSAAFPFALGVAFALLSIGALQRGRRRRFAVLLFLTLLASPLAFLLLVLVLAGGALERPPRRATVVVIAAAVAFELVLRRLFPGQGQLPVQRRRSASRGSLFGVLGIAVTARVAGARRLFGLFAVFLAALLVAFVVPSDLGSNVERLKFAAIPLALLAATLAPKRILLGRRRSSPSPASGTSRRSRTPRARPAPTRAPARLLAARRSTTCAQHLSPSYRVEAVDTTEHWPAAYLPDAGIPIVRGWYRQNDFPQNELLYDRNARGARLRSWLRGLGVRYVVLSDAPPDYSARGEAALIRSGRSGLKPVFCERARRDLRGAATASPIVTGAGDANVFWLWPTRLVFSVSQPGRYRVKVRWSPYWKTSQGCVWRGRRDGALQATQPGFAGCSLAGRRHVQRRSQRARDADAGVSVPRGSRCCRPEPRRPAATATDAVPSPS